MKNTCVLLFLILFPGMMKAQWNDSFGDGNFTSQPVWVGDSTDFKVNSSMQLQINASGEGVSHLSSECITNQEMEWSFWVKMSFSPSDNNYCKVYLISDQPNLESDVNGYYLKLGESGSGDAIELFRQSGSQSVSLCRGSVGLLASSFTIKIKVIHENNGKWSIFADPSGGEEYLPEASATDTSFINGNWFGLLCKYTSSNSTKFVFDDFYAGNILLDDVPPLLYEVTALSSNSLKLIFSEPISPVNMNELSMFNVDKGMGSPILAERDPYDHAQLFLAFSKAFKEDSVYVLSAKGITDLYGNYMEDTMLNFTWHVPHRFDLLINEIMADPDPPVGLPGYEYIELFNNSDFKIDLTGWSISIGNTVKELSTKTISPKGFILLCDDGASAELAPFAMVNGFTSFSLSNTGAEITLRSPYNATIHSVSYQDHWYKNDFKQQGGWSLEQIDPLNPCGADRNWMASTDDRGGTPGEINSVSRPNPDLQNPTVSAVGIMDSLNVSVRFSESMDSLVLSQTMNYSIDQGIGYPISAVAVSPEFKQVVLNLPEVISRGKIYTITFQGFFEDCSGNRMDTGLVTRFALPEKTSGNDLVINEILFNPAEGCSDFIEIFNRSQKVLDLSELTLGEYDTLSGISSGVSELQVESRLIFPGEYIVFTTDTSTLQRCHSSRNPAGLIQVESLPAMGNDEGAISLLRETGELIDWMCYSEEMHYPLLVDNEGVSLERIHPERPGSDSRNWHSAAESAGFATPALQNSQYGKLPEMKDVIVLEPNIFSPDNDGRDDNLIIAYSFESPGNNATVTIYDASGVLVRNLVINELCGSQGSWTWDGIDNRRQKAIIGRYIVHVEVFDMSGNLKKFNRTAVLAGYL
ncbi:MAG: lamin tail domain-containing protein [Bacteroidales bacterium]|nr:lamin tail domain-containing protein [Bacteroidales bacterium]